ncbi:MAG: nicotinate (nicotinamide) nucleotide adenylyltransferase [Chitinophagaceae bacterium]
MKIGLYFGSFNPIHNGHLIIANHILNETDLKKIWFIISPQNPFKQSINLLTASRRLHLVQKAVGEDDRLAAKNIEFSLPKPSYTVSTLRSLQEKYPRHSFSIIMGSDSFQNIDKWKNIEYVIKNYPILIYKRGGFEVNNSLNARIQVLNAPLLQISATHIRKLIEEGKSIKYLVPEVVENEIIANRYFTKS